MDKLIRLIKSINNSDIRKIYKKLKSVNTVRNQAFLFLIQEIRSDKTNSDNIKEKFQKKFPTIKFSKIKYELYEELLKLLTDANKGLTKFDVQLNKIKSLVHLQLLPEAEKRLHKLLERAEAEDEYEIIVQAVNILYNIYELHMFAGVRNKYKILWKFSEKANEFLALQYKYRRFQNEFYNVKLDTGDNDFKMSITRKYEEFKANFNLPPFKYLRVLHYDIEAYYHWLMRDFHKASDYQQKIIDIFINRESLIQRDPNYFAVCINNLAFALSFLQEWEKAEKFTRILLQKARETKDEKISIIFKEKYLMTQTYLLYRSKNKEAILQQKDQLLNLYEEILDKIAPRKLPRTTLNFALMFFIVKDYEKARQFMSELIELSPKILGPKNYLLVLLMNLIINLESGNYDTLPYLMRNTYRYLYKLKDKKYIHPAEEHIFKLIKVLLQKTSQDPVLKELLIKVKNDTQILNYWDNVFDFRDWIEDKIQNLRI